MSFSSVREQKRAKKILAGLLATRRIPSALLFAGLEGTGKTLMAHEFAKALLCRAPLERGTGPSGPGVACGLCADCAAVDKRNHPDVKAVNAFYQASLREEEPAKQRSLRVETIRHLRKDMEMQSLLGGWKVAVVEDAHSLEIEAANALLKIIEEPPPLTLWVLVTPQKERLPKTILSRCFAVPFSPLSAEAVAACLKERGLDPVEAERVAGLCEGSVSRALELSSSPGYPYGLTDNPLSPLAAADALPRELYLARAQVELALFALSQRLRLKHLRQEAGFSRVEGPLREIGRLRQALRSNADPRLILTLAAVEAEGAQTP